MTASVASRIMNGSKIRPQYGRSTTKPASGMSMIGAQQPVVADAARRYDERHDPDDEAEHLGVG